MRENYGTSHGKFDSPLTAYVYEHVILNGGEDDFVGNADLGESVTRIGKRLVYEDSQGFVSMVKEDNAIAAEVVFMLEADDYDAEDEDS